eukprot:TRINITY_DN7111_c0_g1_i1.p1 TRINITY_DN7111_c0_g1~~TRINITY_DN7111_c0_g1_i1.p1  ORF type:complete len:835 (+),score=180.17 TRINITY_DN7111_c0_g1_i1:81-2585(+)
MCRLGVLAGRKPETAAKRGQLVVVPVTGAKYVVDIIDFAAQVTLKQRFENVEENAIEAVYEFVLDGRASVTDFAAYVDGREIKGVLKEKQAAKDKYDDAIAGGGGAYLLEEDKEKPNVFSVSVGNLPPKKEVLIAITYVVEADVTDDGQIRFTIPGAPSNQAEMSPPSGKSIYEKDVTSGGVGITATFNMSSNIKCITSKTHPIMFELGDEPTTATVSLAGEVPAQTADFEILVKTADLNKAMSKVQEVGDGSKIAMLGFAPQLDCDARTECIFLVDRSGSMDGASIEAVRNTLQIFLRSLPEGTLFNIVGFGSSHFKLFDRSVEYNDTNLTVATKHVSKMAADLGGTEILPPLMMLFKEKPIPGIPRQIFLLTDGQVSNSVECIKAVRDNAGTTRIFTFGIGSGVDRELVFGMAKAGEGYCELIQDSQSMNTKVLRQLERALKPALTDITINWGNVSARQAPHILPPLFVGSRLIVYGFLKPNAREGDVVMKATSSAGPITVSVHVNPVAVIPGRQIGNLAARTLIRDLDEGRSGLAKSTAQQVQAEIIALSLKFGVLSKHTAFVVVEKRADATEGTMQLREARLLPAGTRRGAQTTSMLSGGGMTGFPVLPGAPRSSLFTLKKTISHDLCDEEESEEEECCLEDDDDEEEEEQEENEDAYGGAPPPPPPAVASSAAPLVDRDLDYDDLVLKADKDEEKQCAYAPPPLPRAVASSATAPATSDKWAERELMAIIIAQRANGSWLTTVLPVLKVDPAAAARAMPAVIASSKEAEVVWATALACAFIGSHFPDLKTQWSLVVQKASRWLAKTLGTLLTLNELEVLASAFLSGMPK